MDKIRDFQDSILKASDYSHCVNNRKVINRQCLPPIIHIELPNCICESNSYIIQSISCIGSDNDSPTALTDIYYCTVKHPWIDISFKHLEIDVGMHTYRIDLANTKDSDIIQLYFSYIIQDDNPDKSYIYMNRERGNKNG